MPLKTPLELEQEAREKAALEEVARTKKTSEEKFFQENQTQIITYNKTKTLSDKEAAEAMEKMVKNFPANYQARLKDIFGKDLDPTRFKIERLSPEDEELLKNTPGAIGFQISQRNPDGKYIPLKKYYQLSPEVATSKECPEIEQAIPPISKEQRIEMDMAAPLSFGHNPRNVFFIVISNDPATLAAYAAAHKKMGYPAHNLTCILQPGNGLYPCEDKNSEGMLLGEKLKKHGHHFIPVTKEQYENNPNVGLEKALKMLGTKFGHNHEAEDLIRKNFCTLPTPKPKGNASIENEEPHHQTNYSYKYPKKEN